MERATASMFEAKTRSSSTAIKWAAPLLRASIPISPLPANTSKKSALSIRVLRILKSAWRILEDVGRTFLPAGLGTMRPLASPPVIFMTVTNFADDIVSLYQVRVVQLGQNC